MKEDQCPCCAVLPGQWHIRGCDVEQCPYCGGQAVDCDDDDDPIPLDDRLQWSGLFPGEQECLEYGWFARPTRKGWRRCSQNAPGAIPDLNRLRRDAIWDRDNKRFVKRRRSTEGVL